MKTVIISAGHSLSQPGAIYLPGGKENFLTIELTKLVATYLRSHGIGVLEVPDTLSLLDTIKWVNGRASEGAVECAIEIHTNASVDKNAHGVEAWYYHDFNTGYGDENSKRLSQCMVDAINVESGLSVRGVFDESTNKWGRLGFVHDTKPLASLVECGFLSNAEDKALLLSDKGKENISKGVTRGILTYLGEAWKPELINPATDVVNENAKDKVIADLKVELEALKKSSTFDLVKVQDELAALKLSLKKDLESVINRLV
jgi:N-acetylmuramoyl-L-alanine amidase